MSPHGNTDPLAEVMASVADSLHHQAETEDVLRAIVFSARDTIPGAQDVGVSIGHRNGRVETVAATSARVYQVDELQFRLGEGPCVDAVAGRWPAATDELGTDRRWPRYGPRGSRLGIESQLGVRLFDEPQGIAVLNLYSGVVAAFSPDTVHIASLFATHAAHALGRTMLESQLTDALDTRKVIGQAIGIVMERHRLSEPQAFTYLVRASQRTNTKLRLVADQVVRDAETRAEQRLDVPVEQPSGV